MKRKVIAHLWNLPRWFAAPFFGASCLMGSAIAGRIDLNAWIAVIASLLVMAGGHAFNSYLDYAWTGLDKGEKENRSAEKSYTGGQNLIENKIVSLKEVLANAGVWYILSAIPIIYLAYFSTPLILIPWVFGMAATFWYSWGKFNYTHELSLGVAVGPLPMLIGAFAVNANANWINVLLVSIPFAIVLSFAGLALDEWPDAEANLKKGVKSLAFEVWKWSDWTEFKSRLMSQRKEPYPGGETTYITDLGEQTFRVKSLNTLQWYLTSWFLLMFFFQGLLIYLGILKPLTALSFFAFPFLMPCLLFLKSNFNKWAAITVIVGAMYVVLILVGQIFGG